MGIINLSESTELIKELTLNRSIGAIPFAGRYRVIDFALSNMVNSDINNVSIFTQGKTRSLMDHLGSGQPWDLNRKRDGLFIFHPDVSSYDIVQKKGDIEMFKEQLDYMKKSKQEYILMSRSYMVCNIDYRSVVDFHEKTDADITIVYKSMNNSVRRFVNCDTLTMNHEDEVMSIGKNLGKEKYYNVSMEMYLMKKDLLIQIIEDAIHTGDGDYLKQCIFNRMRSLKVMGYRYYGYLSCINSLSNYYTASREMLDVNVYRSLFSGERLIYTKIKDEAPAKYTNTSAVVNSIIGSGSIIEGTVENSIIARGVNIAKGAIVRNSIVMQNANINETSNLNYMIIDKNVTISKKKMLFGDINHPYVVKKNAIL